MRPDSKGPTVASGRSDFLEVSFHLEPKLQQTSVVVLAVLVGRERNQRYPHPCYVCLLYSVVLYLLLDVCSAVALLVL